MSTNPDYRCISGTHSLTWHGHNTQNTTRHCDFSLGSPTTANNAWLWMPATQAPGLPQAAAKKNKCETERAAVTPEASCSVALRRWARHGLKQQPKQQWSCCASAHGAAELATKYSAQSRGGEVSRATGEAKESPQVVERHDFHRQHSPLLQLPRQRLLKVRCWWFGAQAATAAAGASTTSHAARFR